MLSFWEQDKFLSYDYVIVGSGIVGLSTAISIKEKDSKASVLVLERGLLPTGASTKNAGFACFGSLTELLDDLQGMTEEETMHLVNQRVSGLRQLRKRLGDDKLNYLGYGGYELINQEDLGCLEQMERINNMLKPLFDEPVFELSNEKIKEFDFSEDKVPALIFNRYEGQIHTGMMMKNLLALARERGIEILTGASVNAIEDRQTHVTVNLSDNHTEGFNIKAQKVAVCTNAFTKKLFPELELHPGRGIVLITKPIKDLKFKGVFHSDKGYFYFRNYENRVIYGGGRNMDFAGEETTEFAINEKILARLKSELDTTILPHTPYEVEHTWAGIMAFGKNKKPVMKAYSDRVWLGVRLGGMGVAIGSQMGEELAEMMV